APVILLEFNVNTAIFIFADRDRLAGKYLSVQLGAPADYSPLTDTAHNFCSGELGLEINVDDVVFRDLWYIDSVFGGDILYGHCILSVAQKCRNGSAFEPRWRIKGKSGSIKGNMFKKFVQKQLENTVRSYFKKHPEVKLIVVTGSV